MRPVPGRIGRCMTLLGVAMLNAPTIAHGNRLVRLDPRDPKIEDRPAVGYVALRTASPISELLPLEPRLWGVST